MGFLSGLFHYAFFYFRVRQGTAQEITDSEPWKFTKRGSVLSLEGVNACLIFLESHMGATYGDLEAKEAAQLTAMVKFVWKEHPEEAKRQLENIFGKHNKKMKLDFLKTSWASYVNSLKDEDEKLQMSLLETTVLKRIPFIFALFILRTEESLLQ